uniref:WW domain-containing protein n=1 Tax=Syphacia muris TaxID=451379 RepID=A0A0N5B152_9BILA
MPNDSVPVVETDERYGNAHKQFPSSFGQRAAETALDEQEQQVLQQQPMVREDYYGPQEALGWHPRYLSPRPMSKRLVYWQPMKRAVYWQPMKRSDMDREESKL